MKHEDPIPVEVHNFREELKAHPELQARCLLCVSFSEIIAECAAEVGMGLDGNYSHNDILELLRIITAKLSKLKLKNKLN